jgi:hypothetical protein
MTATPRSRVELGLDRPVDEEARSRLLTEVDTFPWDHDIEEKLWTGERLEAQEPPIWYLDRFVPEDGMVVMYGPPKKGKTFLAMEWAFHLAQGLDWHGYNVAMPSRVIYFAAEGLGSLGERQKALRQKRSWEIPPNLLWMTGSRRILGTGMNYDLAEMVRALDHHRPHVAFVDTLMRHTPGSDIASNKDMGQAVEWLDRMRVAFGTTFVLVHHTRKNDIEFMGAQHIYGATDVMVQVKPTDRGTIQLWAETREYDEHSPSFELQIVPVELDRPGWATIESTVRGLSGKETELFDLVSNRPGLLTAEIQLLVWTTKGDNARQVLVSLAEKQLVYGNKTGTSTRWYPGKPGDEVEEI